MLEKIVIRSSWRNFFPRKMRPSKTSYIIFIVLLIPYVLCANENNVPVSYDDAIQEARQLVRNFLNSTANGFAPGNGVFIMKTSCSSKL